MAAEQVLRIDPKDNVLVALSQLPAGQVITFAGEQYVPPSEIPAKQKFAIRDLAIGDEIIMYGGVVGLVRQAIPRGGLLSTRNVQHDASGFGPKVGDYAWTPPDVSGWSSRTFDGYYRADGQVGTRNYWLVIPLVFCENRNIEALRDAFEEELGYGRPKLYRQQVRQLIEQHHQGARAAERPDLTSGQPERIFPNVDGIRFLVHEGGCGGTRQDSKALCGLLAGYIHHPNVAGATVLSLGCQNAQPSILMDALRQRDPALHKPVLMFEQQQSGLESAMLSEAIRTTFEGLVEANRLTRKPAPLSKLTVALKCGGSDGFSGISANPALGHVSDLLAALGAKSILAEFPELCGMEQSLINRCVDAGQADRFIQLMRDYAARAKAVHSGFEMNPSPGNIKDGLITDAMKSAGAARKGGTSPVCAVLDYPEYELLFCARHASDAVRAPKLTLHCRLRIAEIKSPHRSAFRLRGGDDNVVPRLVLREEPLDGNIVVGVEHFRRNAAAKLRGGGFQLNLAPGRDGHRSSRGSRGGVPALCTSERPDRDQRFGA